MIGFVRGLTIGHTSKQIFASRSNRPFYRCHPKLQLSMIFIKTKYIFTDRFIMLNFLVYLQSFAKNGFFNVQRRIFKTAKHFMPRASIWTIWATIFRDFATNFCFRIYYEQALFFLSSSSETRETEKWPRTWLNARDRIGAKFRKTLKIAILYDIGIKVYCLVWRILKQ